MKTVEYMAIFGLHISFKSPYVVHNVHWTYPATGYYKLNTDGASKENFDASTGGVIHDDTRRFIAADALAKKPVSDQLICTS